MLSLWAGTTNALASGAQRASAPQHQGLAPVRHWFPSVSFVDQGMVALGSSTAGSPLDLAEADGVEWTLTSTGGQAQVVIEGVAASPNPDRLDFVWHSRPEAGMGSVVQVAEWFDFQQGAYVPVGTRSLMVGENARSKVSRTANAVAFVEAGTRRVRARITWSWSQPVAAPLALDVAQWQSYLPWSAEHLNFRGLDASTLNTSAHWIRVVFTLGPDRMLGTPQGTRLMFDVTDSGPFDYTFRSELRERNITTFPPNGTSQVYRVRFDVNELPDLYGPTTIFQRFNRDLDGPDIEVELTGANQFSDAVPNDLQVVAFGQRLRLGKFLKAKNDLAVVIYNEAEGQYRVSLNGETLHERSGVDTRASTLGSWTQFGLYPHGLHDPGNRADQIASGYPSVALTIESFEKLHFEGEVDWEHFRTRDRN